MQPDLDDRGAVIGRSTRRRVQATTLAAALLVTLGAAACSSDDESPRGSSTTVTSTSVAPPSTVSDADFENQATTAEAMIRNAGTDPCAVVQAFGPASNLPTPINATQAERGARVVAGLFTSAADSAPASAAADAAVLRQAATDLIAEGEAEKWSPAWLMEIPAAISDPEVTRAFSNYQSAVAASCSAATTTVP